MKNNLLPLLMLSLCASCGPDDPADPAAGHQHAGTDAGDLILNGQQIRLGNIRVDSLKTILLGEEFMLTGTMNHDQRRTEAISSRIMGRIVKLHFRNTGDRIRKGDPVYDIYSEDLNLAIRELQLAAEKSRNLKTDQVDLKKILESARVKLGLYGLSDSQIRDLESQTNPVSSVTILSPAEGVVLSVDVKEGEQIMEGAALFHLSDLSVLWAEGQIYPDLLRGVTEGMDVRVTFPGLPEREDTGKVLFINPELNPSSRITQVRVEISNADRELRPGMQACIFLVTNRMPVPALPTGAILLDAQGATVWVQTGQNRFESRMVTTGMESGGFTEIKGGLNQGDKVVVSGAYLLNSEFIFQKGYNPMEGHAMHSAGKK